jgi:osmoprotectant transport system substrate-binding protein
VLAVLLLVAACGGADDPASGPEIVIGSFGFGESEILGEIYAQGLAAEGYPTSHIAQIGPREIVKPQLEAGEIGFVPEYVGSALEVGFGRAPGSDGERVRTELAAAYEPLGVSVLDLAPVTVTNAFVVTEAAAAQHGLTTISDLSVLETVRLGGPPECPERPRCMIGLATLYGLPIEFTALDAGGQLTIAALQSGEIDVGLFFSTFVFDPTLVQLEDDKNLQPAENVVPVVRTELLDAHGSDLTDRINEISAKITSTGLTELNRQFTVQRRDAAEIAGAWLLEMSLVTG